MHLDSYGLPVQVDGDGNDTLQRTGMVMVATDLEGLLQWDWGLVGLSRWLQPKPGIYLRYVGGDTRNVSGDQLISALCAWIVRRNFKQTAWLLARIFMRLGCAQNTHDMYGREGWKCPDFILLRILPLIPRIHWIFYPLCLLSDLLLIISAITQTLPVWEDDRGFVPRTLDDVDDNLAVMTFITCSAIMPTPLSTYAAKLYGRIRPANLGQIKLGARNPVQGALDWYHRKESGGNPEIAKLYEPLVNRYIYGEK